MHAAFLIGEFVWLSTTFQESTAWADHIGQVSPIY